MEIFKSIKINFAKIGIDSHELSKMHPFNTRNVTSIMIFVLCVILNWTFTFYTSSSFIKRLESFEVGATNLAVGFGFIFYVKDMGKTFKYFDNPETIVNKSE